MFLFCVSSGESFHRHFIQRARFRAVSLPVICDAMTEKPTSDSGVGGRIDEGRESESEEEDEKSFEEIAGQAEKGTQDEAEETLGVETKRSDEKQEGKAEEASGKKHPPATQEPLPLADIISKEVNCAICFELLQDPRILECTCATLSRSRLIFLCSPCTRISSFFSLLSRCFVRVLALYLGLHSFCFQCLCDLAETNLTALRCPVCREETILGTNLFCPIFP